MAGKKSVARAIGEAMTSKQGLGTSGQKSAAKKLVKQKKKPKTGQGKPRKKSSNPRPKTEADELYNARRRLKRQMERLEKELAGATSSTGKRAVRQYLSEMGSALQKSYGLGTAAQRSQAIKLLGQYKTGQIGRRAVQSSNYVFAQQLNLATAGKKTVLGANGEAKARIFYRATQRFWEGAPLGSRNENIMRALGTDSLAEAYERVMREQEEALDALENAGGPVEDTAESRAFQKAARKETEISPIYFLKIKILD